MVSRPKPISIDRWSARTEGSALRPVTAVALVVAVALHLVAFFYLERIDFFQSLRVDREAEQDTLVMEQVVVDQLSETTPLNRPLPAPELSEVPQPIVELEDLLPEIRDREFDLLTELEAPELNLPSSPPLQAGNPQADWQNPTLSVSIPTILDDLGAGIQSTLMAAEGQVVLKEGSTHGALLDSLELLEEASQVGVEGLALEGSLEGYHSLNTLLGMSEISLQGARAALPSDLLFEYDSAQLKPKARFGLMKLAMLIDQNPDMYCILEGHTDTLGGEAYNQRLSQARAESVRDWLVESMHLSDAKIIVRGYGKTQPLVPAGTIEQQAPNRRVDILMRKEYPPATKESSPPSPSSAPQTSSPPAPPVTPTPAPPPPPAAQKAVLVEEDETLPQPAAILVKPRRNPRPQAILIEEEPVPQAIPVQ